MPTMCRRFTLRKAFLFVLRTNFSMTSQVVVSAMKQSSYQLCLISQIPKCMNFFNIKYNIVIKSTHVEFIKCKLKMILTKVVEGSNKLRIFIRKCDMKTFVTNARLVVTKYLLRRVLLSILRFVNSIEINCL
jgi:hypothetical protein